jgi:hypothetical protein
MGIVENLCENHNLNWYLGGAMVANIVLLIFLVVYDNKEAYELVAYIDLIMTGLIIVPPALMAAAHCVCPGWSCLPGR